MSAYAGGSGPQGEQGPPGLDQRPVTWSFDPLVDGVTGDGQASWFVPQHMDGWVLTAVHAGADTPGTGTTTIQIRNATQAEDMLSTRIQIDTGEAHSKDSSVTPVIDATKDDVAYGDKIVVDIDAIGTNLRGLQVQAIFSAP